MKNKETIYWYSPEQIPESNSVLVVFDGVVWAAVYQRVKDEFILYPEDFAPVKRAEVEKWTYYPKCTHSH